MTATIAPTSWPAAAGAAASVWPWLFARQALRRAAGQPPLDDVTMESQR